MAYAPYLCMVIRRQLTPRLRSKFDSMDFEAWGMNPDGSFTESTQKRITWVLDYYRIANHLSVLEIGSGDGKAP